MVEQRIRNAQVGRSNRLTSFLIYIKDKGKRKKDKVNGEIALAEIQKHTHNDTLLDASRTLHTPTPSESPLLIEGILNGKMASNVITTLTALTIETILTLNE